MRSKTSWRGVWPWVLAGTAALTAAFWSMGSAQGGGSDDDGVPRGAVAFFASGTACPVGWAPATAVQGRVVVAVTDGATVGRTVGSPLTDRENRTHTHAVGGTYQLPARAIAAADGTNRQGAESGDQPFSGTLAAAPSGLPFMQLRACVKQ